MNWAWQACMPRCPVAPLLSNRPDISSSLLEILYNFQYLSTRALPQINEHHYFLQQVHLDFAKHRCNATLQNKQLLFKNPKPRKSRPAICFLALFARFVLLLHVWVFVRMCVLSNCITRLVHGTCWLIICMDRQINYISLDQQENVNIFLCGLTFLKNRFCVGFAAKS